MKPHDKMPLFLTVARVISAEVESVFYQPVEQLYANPLMNTMLSFLARRI
jgi:hypothetical protein